ncbi:gastrula zinc finger protein XlCGF57.1-like [Poeciliopsis prolifica]|uniref:gastrula zinc finger protein XlCGF57.1-like n=1 Tax=Poeciliopsis prolifica TaxID=188132 RepID=UPI002413AEDA|nr:gastrula zinc finger protein XlCGF57.1-like [Poeciliopsis prolifica]
MEIITFGEQSSFVDSVKEESEGNQQLWVVKDEIPGVSRSSLDQQNLTCSQVKTEEEEQWISQEIDQLTVKNEEEKPQLPEVHHIKSEDSRETEAPTSSSAEQMKTEPDGEISGGPEPDREPDPSTNLQPNIEKRHLVSSETEVSDEGEDDNLHPGSENEDSDEDWREPRTHQSSVKSKAGHKAAKKAFSCPDCGEQFVRKQMFQKHIAGHSGETSSSCSVEKNHSRGNKNSDAQTRLKPGRKSFSCDNCGKTFIKLAALKCHSRTHCGEKSVVCIDCGKIFHSRDDFKSHRKLHNGEKLFACDKCGKRFSQKHTLKIHMTCHTGEKPFQCELCDKKFTSNGGLKTHMTIHKGVKPFACSDCGRCFRLKSDLKSHKTTHLDIKSFGCGYCGVGFSHKRSLLQHVRLHTGKNLLSCDKCDKKFVGRYYLLRHMRVHLKREKPVTGKGNFSCEECGKRFLQEAHVKSHVVSHTGEKPFSCAHCGAKFTHKRSMLRHVRLHTGENLLSCDKCDKKFARNYYLLRHMRVHAKEEKVETGKGNFACKEW